MARSTVCPIVSTGRCCKSMTGVGIEPTTYGLKVTLWKRPDTTIYLIHAVIRASSVVSDVG